MKRSLLFVILLWALALTAQAKASTIYVQNQNPGITPQAFEATVQAIQAQLNTELEPAWSVHTVLKVGEPPEGAWSVQVSPKFGFALGYHDLALQPYAVVYSADTDYNWQNTLSHEIVEMVVDPYIDRIVKSNRLWLVEIADPVEAESLGKWVSVNGVPVLLSDFVYPAWYSGNADKLDAYGHVKRAHQILPGGFAYYWSPLKHNWLPLYGKEHRGTKNRHLG